MVSFPDPKKGHPYHMYAMIHAQPQFIAETRDRVRGTDFVERLRGLRHLVLTGCGTSFHAAIYGAKILQAALGPACLVQTIHAYDVAYTSILEGTPTVLGVSHSGSTPTTNRALSRAKRRGLRTMAVSGLSETPMERIADDTLVVGSLHDRSWANTMSYTTQLTAFATLAEQSRGSWADLRIGLRALPAVVEHALRTESAIKRLSRKIARKERMTFLATGWDQITALESALKIRETCGMTASAYHAEQFIHGSFLSIDRGEFILFLRSQEDGTRADIVRMALAKSGAEVAVVGEHRQASIRTPRTHSFLRPIVSVIPLQLLAYYAALARHSNPDIMRTDTPRLRAGVEALFQ